MPVANTWHHSLGNSGHQPSFPEWWDNLPPTVQKTARQQHHICSRGYSLQSGTELLPTHGPSPSRCSDLLWLNVLFTGNWGWRHRERSLDTIERHLQQAVHAIQEWATRNGFRFAAHKCKVIHFTAPRSRVQRPPIVRIGNTLLPVDESTKLLGLWGDSHLSFKKHISVLKTQCKEALNLIRVVAHLKWGGDRDTLLML